MQTRFSWPSRAARVLGLASVALATACGDDVVVDSGTVAPDLVTSNPVDLAGCHADADCPRGRHCDLPAATCVDCLTDGDCPDGGRCAAHACVPGCSRAHGCGDAGVCEADAGVCLECRRDADCHDAKRRHCDVPGGGRCQPCLPSNDDCAPGSYCAQAGGEYGCVPGCRRDADCIAMGDGGVNAIHCLLATHQCVPCLADGDCLPGTVCAANACAPGCNNQHVCDGGKSCCGGACVDPMVDVANCGMCGTACNQGAAPTCCGGGCADLAADPTNCGACGAACKLANAKAACTNKVCSVAACIAGFGDCNGMAGDGCEVSIASDLANCGKCGVPCATPNASPACIGGICQVGACKMGFIDCNHLAADGCEIDGANDNQNCGVCGSVCMQLPHASAVCKLSVCAVTACDVGYGNCDLKDANGCETPLAADAANCGACGKPCVVPANSVAVCANAMCSNGGCKMGFGDCDNNANNGCEADFSTDRANCGGCGKACPQGSVCVGGMCSAFYGGGQAGALTVNANTNFGGYRETHLAAAAVAGTSSLTLVDGTGFVAGDKVLVINVRSANGNAGIWEVADVASVNQNTLKVAAALTGNYSEPANTLVRTMPQYTTVSIANGFALSASPWDPVTLTGGIVAFFANVSVTVDGRIAANGTGYRGGIGNDHDPNVTQWKMQGESYPGPGMTDNVNNVGNGGGGNGGGKRGFCEGSGGGGGGHVAGGATGGNNVIACGSIAGGVGGLSYGDPQLTRIYFGSGGGSGGYTTNPAQGAGGNGGGMILIFAPKITINGALQAIGADGTAEFGDYGGGGGGSGGSIYLRTQQNVVGGGNAVVGGGAGGAANGRQEVGGAGSAGRVFIEVKP